MVAARISLLRMLLLAAACALGSIRGATASHCAVFEDAEDDDDDDAVQEVCWSDDGNGDHHQDAPSDSTCTVYAHLDHVMTCEDLCESFDGWECVSSYHNRNGECGFDQDERKDCGFENQDHMNCECRRAPPTGSSGNLQCGAIVTGDTSNAVHVVGHASGEHFYRLAVAVTQVYNFSTCTTSPPDSPDRWDTQLRLYSGDHPDASSQIAENVRHFPAQFHRFDRLELDLRGHTQL